MVDMAGNGLDFCNVSENLRQVGMKTKIVLVATPGNHAKEYLAHIQKYDVDVKLVETFRNLENVLSQEPYNGIIVDLKTKLKAPREHKELAYEVLEHYPVLQARLIPESDKLQTIPFGKASKEISLEAFLTDLCPRFHARKIRTSIRRRVHFNTLLSSSGSFDMQDVVRTITLNVSAGGCFIITSQNMETGSNVAFIFKELATRTPIIGEVRWGVTWGRQMAVPGVGIKFEDIEDKQIQELTEKYGLE